MRVGEHLQLRKVIRCRALAGLCLFVRWKPLPPPSREIRILYRIIGLAHPEYIVTESREVQIYRSATPVRQNPPTIPGNIDQSTDIGLTAGWQPVIQTRNPWFLIFTRLGGEPGRGVFPEERQQFRGFYVFAVRVCARSDDSEYVLHSQDGQGICYWRA